jgi:hypothetical protein
MDCTSAQALPDYRVHHVLASAAAPLEHVPDGAIAITSRS